MAKNKKETEEKETPVEEMEPIKISLDEEEKFEEKKNPKIEEYVELAQRIQAEFENYKKRNVDSIRTARFDGINDVILELLPIIDNFERGISVVKEEKEKSGLELIYKQLVALINKFDVVEIDALGQDFDPNLHHAIAQCEDPDNANKVVEVFQKGYKRKDKVLRASLVKVAQ